MSIVNSLFNAGSVAIKTTAKIALITARVAVVSAVTISVAVAATVVNETTKAANEIQADPNVKAGIDAGKTAYAASVSFAQSKAAAFEAAASAFEARHK